MQMNYLQRFLQQNKKVKLELLINNPMQPDGLRIRIVGILEKIKTLKTWCETGHIVHCVAAEVVNEPKRYVSKDKALTPSMSYEIF